MAVLTTAADCHLRSSQTMGLLARSAFSISVWINAVWNPGSRRSIVGVYGPATDVALGTPIAGVQIGTSAGGGDLTCWTWGGGTLVGTAAGVMTALNNTWAHIVYTFDGTTHRVYLNGVLGTSQLDTVSPQITGYLNQVYINGYPGGVVNEVTSFYVDQYNLYRRTLAADEIGTMYNAGGARHGIMNDLICRYEFDELASGSTASSIVDLTGNGHTLTITGASTAITHSYVNSLANSNIRPVQT
jgi:hypothetical protein